MATRIGSNHKVVNGPDGRTRLIVDQKAIDAKKPVNKRIADRNSKKVRVKKPGITA